jgi:LysR family glycine cleavage system transcriptional activator
MPQSLPPLGWFRAFECSARHLSFTAAAEEMNLTQSAISQQVRALEIRLGATLFQRKPRGLAMTDAGHRLLPQATEAIEKLTAATAMFQAPVQRGTLRLACPTSFAVLWLIPRLAGFLATNPEAHVQLVSTLWPEDAAGAEVDVEIRWGIGRPSQTEVLIRRDVLVPVCAPAMHEHLSASEICWHDNPAAPFIRTVALRDNWNAWAKSMALKPPTSFVHSVDSHLLAIDLARAGFGIALVCRMLVEADLESGRLVAIGPDTVPALEGYQVSALRPDTGGLPSRFINWLASQR